MFVSAWLLGCGVLADGSLLEPVPESAAEDVPDVDHELTLSHPVSDPPQDPPVELSDCDEAWEACVVEGDWLGCEEPYRGCIGGEWPSAYHCERLIEVCLGAGFGEEDCAGIYWECVEPTPPYEDPEATEALCYEMYEECLAAGEYGAVCEEELYFCLEARP